MRRFDTLAYLLLAVSQHVMADNPIISHKFTADPSALVHEGRVYVYCSNDDNNTSNAWKLVDYTLISSDDLVNWTDHGQIFNAKNDTEWANLAFAPSCIEKGGKFYLYFPDGGNSIGVAVADRPEGPFVDVLGKPLIKKSAALNSDVPWCFDPCVFMDDGEAYLYFGGGKSASVPFGENLRVIKLNEDMVSTTGTARTIISPISFEGPFMHKRNDVYYFSYPCRSASDIHYLMGDNPWVENFKHLGSVLDNPVLDGKKINRSSNSHSSFIEFNGQGYCFYHDRRISDASKFRNVSLDRVEYNADGTFRKVVVTSEGVEQLKLLNPYERVESETIDRQKGIEVEFCTEGGSMLAALSEGDWTSVSGVDFGAGASRFEARVASQTGGGRIELHLGSPTGVIVGVCTIPKTGRLEKWETVECLVEDCRGVNNLFLVYRETGESLLFNWYRFIEK